MRLNNFDYIEQIRKIANKNYNWARLKNKTILITGITGMIGTVIADLIMYKNVNDNLNCHLIGVSRKEETIKERFKEYLNNSNFSFKIGDVTDQHFADSIENKIDYIFHGASNTHPVAYAKEPVNTIMINVLGINNLYKLAIKSNIEKFICASSVEIYGENKGDVELFDEEYLGYINCSSLRAGYPESKRLSETICHAYYEQYGINFNIIRFSRVYGPTMLNSDTKALSQFIKKALNNEDIVLKSKGTQLYSYVCAFDAADAFFLILMDGESCETYNVAGEDKNVTLSEIASICADCSNKKVVFEIPDSTEAKGYSKATKALLDISKIKKLGWEPSYATKEGIRLTINIMKKLM